MPFRDLGFNFTYYYFINSLVCDHSPLQLVCDGKGTATFARFQKIRRNLPGVVATGLVFCDRVGEEG
jgi:hypothetical protein